MRHVSTENVFLLHLKFKFIWVFCVLSGNPPLTAWPSTDQSVMGSGPPPTDSGLREIRASCIEGEGARSFQVGKILGCGPGRLLPPQPQVSALYLPLNPGLWTCHPKLCHQPHVAVTSLGLSLCYKDTSHRAIRVHPSSV